ncbi:MAG: hypothetical protein ACXU8A_01900 [Burkholderiaceae bacterium]
MTNPADANKSSPKSLPAVEAKPKTAAQPKKAPPKKTVAPAKKSAPAKSASKVKKATSKPTVKAKPVTTPKEKIKKSKLVRDSFTMPETEYAALGEVKKMCLKAGIEVKKSELLRVGVAHIRKMDLAVLKQALSALAPLKAGRPKNNAK